MMLLNKYKYYIFFIFYLFTLWGCTKDEPSKVQKETFIKSFGGAYENEAIDLIQNNDNYYFLGNEKDEDKQSNIVLIKTDDFGNRIWEKSYITEDKQTLANQFIKLENQDGFAIIGSMEMDDDSLYYDAYLLVVNENGDVLFEKTYDFQHSEYGKCIAELDDGGFTIAVSQSTSNNSNINLSLFSRLNSNGEIEPLSTSSIPGTELFQIYKNLNNKGFFITGHNLTPEIFIIDPDGTFNELFKYDIPGKIFSITQDNNENTFICGELKSGTNGGKDGFIAKLENIYESIDYKLKEFGGIKNDYFNNIIITNDNNILVTGSIENTQAVTDIWVLKTDIEGQQISESIIGGDNNEYGVKILESESNRFIVLGTAYFESSSFISVYKLEFQ